MPALMRGWRRAGPWLLFLALILFSLRYLLALPGTLGHSWDWEISALAPQLWGRLSHDLFVWDYQIRAGYYNLFRTNGWYSFLALPFSFLGGEIYSRLYVILPLFLAAVCMRRLAQDGLGLASSLSTAAGVLYMLSPVVFSRILTGHTLLFAYALLPLLVLYVDRTLQAGRAGCLAWRDAIIAGLLLGAQGIHPSMMVMAFAVVGFQVLLAVLQTRPLLALWAGPVIIGAIFGLLNLYWALPLGAGYLTTGSLYHSGSVVDTPDEVTAATVINQRVSLQTNSQQTLQEALRENAVSSYNTEFAYPIPDALQPFWLIASFLIPLAAFATLLRPGPSRDLSLVLALAGLLGATLVSGSLLPPGAAIYQWLMQHAFPVWAEFGSTVRALPLVALAYSALAPALLQTWPRGLSGRARKGLMAGAAAVLVVYVAPFLSGWGLVDPSSLLTVRAYRPSMADLKLYEYLKQDQADVRITYVPPPWIYHAENYDLGYEWTGGLSAHPEFFVPYYNARMWATASDFRADIHPSISGKLLGLAAVKYLVYPRTRFITPSLGVTYPPAPLNVNNLGSARFTDQVLQTQPNWEPVTLPVTGTLVYRNADYAPHIYAASQTALILGDSNTLPAYVDSSLFEHRPALFFDTQMDAPLREHLSSQVDRVVNTRATTETTSAPVPAGTAFLFRTEPLTPTAASLVVPQDNTYVLQVQAVPFQVAAPEAGRQETATFDPAAARGRVTWSGSLPYHDTLATDGTLRVAAFLDSATAPDAYAQLDQPVELVDLAEFPFLRLTSGVENTQAQAVTLQVRLDTDGDGAADTTYQGTPFSHTALKADEVNLLSLVRQEFPGRPSYTVAGIGVRFQKKPHQVWQKVSYPARLYTYEVTDLGFYGAASGTKPGWVWRPEREAITGEAATLARALDNLQAQRYPVYVEYDVDGPAPLYVDVQLTLETDRGQKKTISAGSELLQPFSHGMLTLDARGAILGAIPENADENWVATRVEVAARRLAGGPQMRTTVLALGRIGAAWLPAVDAGTPIAAETTPAPVLTIDGQAIALEAAEASAGHRLYKTPAVNLTAGRHTVLATFPGHSTRYAVEQVLAVPSEAPKSAAPPVVAFENVNPTRFRVHVTNARAPYFLVFADNFHTGWHAYVEPATPASRAGGAASTSEFAVWTPERWYAPSALLSLLLDGHGRQEIADHYIVNGFANAWRVDQTGSYDIVLEFLPQRVYEGGLIVSIGTFIVCWVLLLAARVRRNRV